MWGGCEDGETGGLGGMGECWGDMGVLGECWGGGGRRDGGCWGCGDVRMWGCWGDAGLEDEGMGGFGSFGGDVGLLGRCWGCGDGGKGGRNGGPGGRWEAGGLLGGGTGPRAHSALCSPWFWGGAAPEGQQGPTSGQSPHFRSELPTFGQKPPLPVQPHPLPPPRQQFPVRTPNLESKFPSSDLGPPLPVRPRPLPVTPSPHCRSERPNFQPELPTSAPTSQLPLRTLDFWTELPTSGLKPPHFRSEFFISKVKLVFCSKPHFQPETPLPL